MKTLTWRERLAGDRRVIAIGDADRYGALWIYCDCRNPRAAASLLTDLQQRGVKGVARKGPAALWLEAE
jgi:hypothetical protein